LSTFVSPALRGLRSRVSLLVLAALLLTIAPSTSAVAIDESDYVLLTHASWRTGEVSPELRFERRGEDPPWSAPSEVVVTERDSGVVIEEAIVPGSLHIDEDDARVLHVEVGVVFDDGSYEVHIEDSGTVSWGAFHVGSTGGGHVSLEVLDSPLPHGFEAPYPLTIDRSSAWSTPDDLWLLDEDWEVVPGAFDPSGAVIDEDDPHLLHLELQVALPDGWYEIAVHEGDRVRYAPFSVGAGASDWAWVDLSPGWLETGYEVPLTIEAERYDRDWSGEVAVVVQDADGVPFHGVVDPASPIVDGAIATVTLVGSLAPGWYYVNFSDELGSASGELYIAAPDDGTWAWLRPDSVARGEQPYVFEVEGDQTAWSQEETLVRVAGWDDEDRAVDVSVLSPNELVLTIADDLPLDSYTVTITTGDSQQSTSFAVWDELATATYTFTGTISDDVGTPIEGACVEADVAVDATTYGGWLRGSTSTMGDGSYEVEVPVRFAGEFEGAWGNVFVWDCATEGAPRFEWDAAWYETAAEAETWRTDFSLRRIGNLTGTVLDGLTGTAPEACVQVYQYEEGERTWASAKVIDGRFELWGLPVGEAVLGVDSCSSSDPEEEARYRKEFPYEPQFLDGKASYDEADRFAVPMGGPTDIGVFTLDRAAAPLGADLLSYHEGSGRWWQTTIVDGEAEQRLVTTYGTRTGWQTHLTADMTGDGYTEILSYHESSGRWWMTSVDVDGTATQTLLATYGTRSGWDAHLAADVTGDGSAELLSYHASSGRWWMTSLDGSTATQTLLTTYGTTSGWEAHLAADLTGDGRAELLSYHPSRGRWWMTTVEGDSATQSLLTTYGTRTGWQAHLAGVLPHRG
jgi:hypothetical protein